MTNYQAGVASAEMAVLPSDPLVAANGYNIPCPSSSINGTCYSVTISCPNIDNFAGYVKVTYPAAKPLGTVLFSTGGTGAALYETYTSGATTMSTIVHGGHIPAQVAWGGPLAVHARPCRTGPR